MTHTMNIAVVIPAFRVRRHILGVIEKIGPLVSSIFVVDDCCPEKSGQLVEKNCADSRVRVIYNPQNLGVGGATMTGYRAALKAQAEIVVKLDGDGQMDPAMIERLIGPIERGLADYTKGNRFFGVEYLEKMPLIRMIGNSGLSFISKLVSGYWHIMDPTNGFTAIHRCALEMLPLEKIEQRYFFENDMLFRLNTIRAVVCDIPMPAHYGDEHSSLRIGRVLLEFPRKFITRFIKRVVYSYFLRDFNACSIQIIAGLILLLGGTWFGLAHWYYSSAQGVVASTGTVMLASLPVILGFQLLLSAITFDTMNIPSEPLQNLLGKRSSHDRELGRVANL